MSTRLHFLENFVVVAFEAVGLAESKLGGSRTIYSSVTVAAPAEFLPVAPKHWHCYLQANNYSLAAPALPVAPTHSAAPALPVAPRCYFDLPAPALPVAPKYYFDLPAPGLPVAPNCYFDLGAPALPVAPKRCFDLAAPAMPVAPKDLTWLVHDWYWAAFLPVAPKRVRLVAAPALPVAVYLHPCRSPRLHMTVAPALLVESLAWAFQPKLSPACLALAVQ